MMRVAAATSSAIVALGSYVRSGNRQERSRDHHVSVRMRVSKAHQYGDLGFAGVEALGIKIDFDRVPITCHSWPGATAMEAPA